MFVYAYFELPVTILHHLLSGQSVGIIAMVLSHQPPAIMVLLQFRDIQNSE